MNKNLFLYLFILFLLQSCSGKDNDKVVDKILNKDLDSQMIESYNEGFEALNSGDGYTAAKKFSEAEIFYPQSKWAPRSSLMTAYSYYSVNLYTDTIAEINRYLKTYPLHERHNYAYYLLALSYYEQIVDEKKDLGPLLQAQEKFNFVIKNYPDSDYALDAEYKLDLIQDYLASKEMYIASHYMKKKKWIASINRYKTVVEQYQKTIYVEEALHRLVELYFTIGLENESQRYASLLGYNYQSSKWYEKSYKIFNQQYETKIELKKEKKGMLKKFKKLFD